MNQVLSQIFRDVSFTNDQLNVLDSKLKRVEFKKGSTLLAFGEQVTDQYYVASGCVRAFFSDESGKEHTIQFAIQDWWISDYTAFFTGSKAILQIECIQDSILYKMSSTDREQLFVQIPSLESFFRKKMEGAFASFQKRIVGNLSQTATQRYQSFIATYPNIEQQVKNYHIASYLGITTESLSRIRKEITL